ncbi:hypothetical protein FSP39_014916 [Pinctada imbricata]|uniref:Neurotransmitter-gated ion-channel ligand-binding domain-containing protein n=1 Tax=Pinctada imbricata TaxID=66713 RepID=A0AA88XD32_PINIB|nr:hypothetical protein FSP39_014916 [Pinctada imbricata]
MFPATTAVTSTQNVARRRIFGSFYIGIQVLLGLVTLSHGRSRVDNIGVMSDSSLQVRVSKSGRVTWAPTDMFTTNCVTDVTYYPFDTQTCDIILTSWGYTQTELIFRQDQALPLGMVNYQENGEWEYIGYTVTTAIYLISLLIADIASVILTVLILDLYHKDPPKPVPKFLQKVIGQGIGRLVCYRNKSWRCRPKNENAVLELKEKSSEKKISHVDESDDDEDDEFTWQDLSKILDIFFFAFYCLFLLFTTMIFLIVMSR